LEGTGRRPRSGRRTRGGSTLGVNLEGAAVIIELLDRIDLLEHRLRHLERR
jgi:hypothetical protein